MIEDDPAQQPEPAHEFMTVAEVVAYVRVNEFTVRKWLRTGELRGIKLSNKSGYRIRREDLQAFLDARTLDNAQET